MLIKILQQVDSIYKIVPNYLYNSCSRFPETLGQNIHNLNFAKGV